MATVLTPAMRPEPSWTPPSLARVLHSSPDLVRVTAWDYARSVIYLAHTFHLEPIVLSSATHYAVHVCAAILMIVVGWWVSNRVSEIFLKAFSHTHIDPTLAPMLKSISAWSVRAIVAIGALNEIGIATASVLAVLGAAGLAVGLALQGTLQNIAAGMMLLLLRPFHAGDLVETNNGTTNVGTTGIIKEVGLFTTLIERSDGNAVHLPNSLIWSNPIINYTSGGTQRIAVEVDLSQHTDVDDAIEHLSDLVGKEPRVLADDALAPVITVVSYPRSGGARLRISAWVRGADPLHVQSDLQHHAYRMLTQAGLVYVAPHQIGVQPASENAVS